MFSRQGDAFSDNESYSFPVKPDQEPPYYFNPGKYSRKERLCDLNVKVAPPLTVNIFLCR